MPSPRILAIGYACYDLTFAVEHHMGADEKGNALDFTGCGGGLAANAAAAAGRLGYDVILASFLGQDAFGDAHAAELQAHGVNTDYLLRTEAPTGVSTILVKPDGRRTLVAYRGQQPQYPADALNLATLQPHVILVDGHQTQLAHAVLAEARHRHIPTVLDADGVSVRTNNMAACVDHLVASERFAYGYTGRKTIPEVLAALSRLAPNVVVTRGDKGLVWMKQEKQGALPAYQVPARDTNGAGDAFHGAYAGGVAEGMDWNRLLRFASATAALCCCTVGSRNGLPRRSEVEHLMQNQAL